MSYNMWKNSILGDGYNEINDGPPRKTKFTHPYSYDPITQFMLCGVEPTSTVYTDRLTQWDFAKHDRLCQKHFGNRGQYWDGRSPKLTEAFLRDWYDDPELILTAIIEYCNVATGYPCWRLDFKCEPKPTATT